MPKIDRLFATSLGGWLAVSVVLAAVLASPTSAAAVPLDFDRLVVQAEGGTNFAATGDAFRTVVLDTMRQEGYQVAGGETSAFRGHSEDDAFVARYVVAGIVEDLECLSESPWGACQILIRWQLLDRSRDQIVYELGVAAWSEARTGWGRDWKGRTQVEAVLSGLRTLLRKDAFEEVVSEGGTVDLAVEPEPPIAVPPCEAGPGALPGDLERAKAASVLIEAGPASGTGVFVSPAGYVLTAAHLVGERAEVKVKTLDGATLLAAVVRRDATADVALLHTGGRDHACALLADSRPDVGSDVFAIGNPGGGALAFSVTRGVVSGTRADEGRDLLQTDLSISPGYSGGGLWSPDGRVAAIISHKLVGEAVEGLGFATDVDSVVAALGIHFGELGPEPVVDQPGPEPLPEVPRLVDEGDEALRTMSVPDEIKSGRALKSAGPPFVALGAGLLAGGVVLTIAGEDNGRSLDSFLTAGTSLDGVRDPRLVGVGVAMTIGGAISLGVGITTAAAGKSRIGAYMDGVDERSRAVRLHLEIGPARVALRGSF